MLAVVHRDAAFPSVVRKAAFGGTFVEGLDGVGGQCTKAHSRDVQQRHRIGLAAVRSTHRDAQRRRVELFRAHRVRDPLGASLVHVLDAAKTAFVVLFFGSGIDHGTLAAREGQLLLIVFQKVLAQFRADVFECVTQSASDRVIAANGLLGLQDILDTQGKQTQKYQR